MIAPVSIRFLSGPIITRDGEGMHALRGIRAAFHFNDSVARLGFDIISRFISCKVYAVLPTNTLLRYNL